MISILTQAQPPKQKDDDNELIQLLQSELEFDDKDDSSKSDSHKSFSVEESPRTNSPAPPSPISSSPDLVANEQLQTILERKRAFEIAISSLNTLPDISDADRACLRRYERLLTSINAMATKAKNNLPIDLSELPPPPPQIQPTYQPLESNPPQHVCTSNPSPSV